MRGAPASAVPLLGDGAEKQTLTVLWDKADCVSAGGGKEDVVQNKALGSRLMSK